MIAITTTIVIIIFVGVDKAATSPFDSVVHSTHCFFKLYVSSVHIFLYVCCTIRK